MGRIFAELSKEYFGTFSRKLEHLPIKRYYYALIVIAKYDGDLSQTVLGEELYLDKASVVRMLDYLQEAGCITRKCNPDDRRAHILELTAKSRAMIPEIEKAVNETNALCLEALDVDPTTVEDHIHQIRCNLSSQPKQAFHIHFVKRDEIEN